MIDKKIQVCIGTDRSKCIRARLSLLLVDGEVVISEHYHSVNIEPGTNLAATRAAIEKHIATADGGVPGAPWPKIPDSEWAEVEQVVGVIHKPAVVAAFQEAKQKRLADELKFMGSK